MNCRRCRTDNPEASRYCSACGALLTGPWLKPRRTVPWFVIRRGGILIVVAAAYFPLPGFGRPRRPAAPARPRLGSRPRHRRAFRRPEAIPGPSTLALVAGRFAFEDCAVPRGPLRSKAPSSTAPGRPCRSGAFLGSSPRLSRPRSRRSCPGLGRLELPASPSSSAASTRRRACRRRSSPPTTVPPSSSGVRLSGERTSFAIETGPLRTAGCVQDLRPLQRDRCARRPRPEGRIVGWTFGHGVARGYLWSPADGAGPEARSFAPTGPVRVAALRLARRRRSSRPCPCPTRSRRPTGSWPPSPRASPEIPCSRTMTCRFPEAGRDRRPACRPWPRP